MRLAADFETPNSGASWRSVKFVRQYTRPAVLQRQAPRTTPADCIRPVTPQHRHQLAETARAQPGERAYPGRLQRRDHTSHAGIISPEAKESMTCRSLSSWSTRWSHG